jgi:hypothetical protein
LFEIQTKGVRPWNTPTPPRSCCLPAAPMSQLNPTRGSHEIFSVGTADVEKPIAVCTAGLNDGVVLNFGLSARRPKVSRRAGLTCHWSLA